MQLNYFKVDITEQAEGKLLTFAPGCIEFVHDWQAIALNEPLVLTVTHDGMYHDILRNAEWVIYDDNSTEVVGFKSWSVFSLVLVEGFERAVHDAVARQCKIVPMRYVDERELLAKEYEQSFKKLLGV